MEEPNPMFECHGNQLSLTAQRVWRSLLCILNSLLPSSLPTHTMFLSATALLSDCFFFWCAKPVSALPSLAVCEVHCPIWAGNNGESHVVLAFGLTYNQNNNPTRCEDLLVHPWTTCLAGSNAWRLEWYLDIDLPRCCRKAERVTVPTAQMHRLNLPPLLFVYKPTAQETQGLGGTPMT